MTSYDSLANVHLSKYIIQNVRTGSFSWCNYIMLLISKHLSHNVQVHLEKFQLFLMSCDMKPQLLEIFILSLTKYTISKYTITKYAILFQKTFRYSNLFLSVVTLWKLNLFKSLFILSQNMQVLLHNALASIKKLRDSLIFFELFHYESLTSCHLYYFSHKLCNFFF